MFVSPDTTQESQKTLTEIYRKMSPEQKFRRIFNAYKTGQSLAIAGLKRLHPDASDSQLWHLWARQHLGDDLYEQVYGHLKIIDKFLTH